MATSEIDGIRAMLQSKPRPVGWAARRHRLDDIGSVWPVADDVKLKSVDVDGDDATRLANVAGAADVSVILEIWPYMIHAWPLWNAQLEPGRRALASAGAFIRAHL